MLMIREKPTYLTYLNIFTGVICNFAQYLPQLLYLMDFMNYFIDTFYLKFNLYCNIY